MSRILQSFSHLSDQQNMLHPLPTKEMTKLANSCLAYDSMGSSRPLQGLFGSIFCTHNHFICKAQLIYCRFRIPMPPRLSGLVTLSHVTKQLPSFTSFLPFQIKPRRSLSIDLITHLGTFMAMRRYTGIVESTNQTRVVLPARLSRDAFQLGRRSAIFSIHCKRSPFLSFLLEIGNPR
jgi:hypothetical protein